MPSATQGAAEQRAEEPLEHRLYRCWQTPGKAVSTQRWCWKGQLPAAKGHGRSPRPASKLRTFFLSPSLIPSSGVFLVVWSPFLVLPALPPSLLFRCLHTADKRAPTTSSLPQERNLFRGFSFQLVSAVCQTLQTDFTRES